MSQLIKETVTQIGQELFRRSDMSLDRWPRDLSEISRNVAGKFFAHPVSSRCLACGALHGFLDFPMGKVTFPDELTEQTRQPSHRECPQDAWISEKQQASQTYQTCFSRTSALLLVPACRPLHGIAQLHGKVTLLDSTSPKTTRKPSLR